MAKIMRRRYYFNTVENKYIKSETIVSTNIIEEKEDQKKKKYEEIFKQETLHISLEEVQTMLKAAHVMNAHLRKNTY